MTPAPGYAIIRKKEPETTPAGVVLASEDASTAVVVATAAHYYVNGHRYETWLEPGDEVLLGPGCEAAEHAALPQGYALAQIAHLVCKVGERRLDA